jgi:hypothetical protein
MRKLAGLFSQMSDESSSRRSSPLQIAPESRRNRKLFRVRKSSWWKQLQTFILTVYWGTSALDDGLEALGFEVVARIRGGLRVCIRPDLHAGDGLGYFVARVFRRADSFYDSGKTLASKEASYKASITGRIDPSSDALSAPPFVVSKGRVFRFRAAGNKRVESKNPHP